LRSATDSSSVRRSSTPLPSGILINLRPHVIRRATAGIIVVVASRALSLRSRDAGLPWAASTASVLALAAGSDLL